MDPKTEPRKRRKVYFYVDGFNLYHRRLEKNPHLKWLCLKTLAEKYLFSGDDVLKTKLFTAKVDPKSATSPRQARQLHYWEALKSTGVEVIEGVMEPKERECKITYCDKPGSKFQTWAEKMSDVNLALHVLRDFIDAPPDVICILSGDLDVIPALKMVRERLPRTLNIVILPNQDEKLLLSRQSLLNGVAITRQLSEDHLKGSRMPENVGPPEGKQLACPPHWAGA
jgi:uncharacterized LabA/DUF88 family protein